MGSSRVDVAGNAGKSGCRRKNVKEERVLT